MQESLQSLECLTVGREGGLRGRKPERSAWPQLRSPPIPQHCSLLERGWKLTLGGSLEGEIRGRVLQPGSLGGQEGRIAGLRLPVQSLRMPGGLRVLVNLRVGI